VDIDPAFNLLVDGSTPRGRTLLKRRHLAQLGYSVAAVPAGEWGALKSEDERRRFLADKIKEV